MFWTLKHVYDTWPTPAFNYKPTENTFKMHGIQQNLS